MKTIIFVSGDFKNNLSFIVAKFNGYDSGYEFIFTRPGTTGFKKSYPILSL